MYFQLLCIIVSNESDVAAFKDFTPSEDAPAPAAAAPPPPPPPPAAAPAPVAAPPPTPAAAPAPAPVSTPSGGFVYASPRAKKLAADKNVDLAVSYFRFYLSL